MDFLKRETPNRSSFRARHGKILGLGLLAVAAVIIAVLALTTRDSGVRAAPVPPAASPQASQPSVPNIDVIGDSYVGGSDQGGYGAANWTKVVGSRFYQEGSPVDMNVTAVPGAGYISRGPGKATFAEAATSRLRSSADLVLVFGSRNDGKQDPATMAAAAKDLYGKIRERAPHAKLVVVGPAWVNENVPGSMTSNTKAMSGAAAAAGADFVSPLSDGWFFGADAKLIGADGVHPTDAGHQYLAGKMYAIISTALASMATS